MTSADPASSPVDQPVPLLLAEIAVRLADEGIPLRPIARALKRSSEEVRIVLSEAVQLGGLIEMPKDDWPPTGKRADHLPTVRGVKMNQEQIAMNCSRRFGVSKLEAMFMAALLRNNEVTKTVLHNIIEQQRAVRATKGDTAEETDPKMVDVVICKLRKRLRAHKLEIHTIWACGYYMDPEQCQRASNMLTEYAEGQEKLNG